MTTAAAIDRLVHHSVILEMAGESKRKQSLKPWEKESNPASAEQIPALQELD